MCAALVLCLISGREGEGVAVKAGYLYLQGVRWLGCQEESVDPPAPDTLAPQRKPSAIEATPVLLCAFVPLHVDPAVMP